MASTVLFIVSIPTEDEELRLKAEFIAKKLEKRGSDANVSTSTANAKGGPPPLAELPELVDYDDDGNNDDAVTADGALAQSRRRKSEATLKLDGNDQGSTTTDKTLRPIASATACLKDMASELDTEIRTPTGRKSSEDVLNDLIQSSKLKTLQQKMQQQPKKPVEPLDLDKPSDVCMEVVVREILKKFQVTNAVWSMDANKCMHQIVFTVEFNEVYEQILDKFQNWGIGDRAGSVSVMNCVTSKHTKNDDDSGAVENDEKQGAWDRFMNSVRSRLNVSQVVQNVRQDAAITFDFLVLLISAAILAAFGLVENSTVFLVASMLISPLMGPIIAVIFGTVIKDSKLYLLGVKNELFGLLAAIIVGFVFGLIICVIDNRFESGQGISDEMKSRCELHSLIVGVFTAIPSGAAAAVGLLGGNVGSLVGVAISASLLPPAVNTGLLFSLTIVYKIFEDDDTVYTKITDTEYYSSTQSTELLIMAMISMCLTISNIICVYLMGIVVLKVKEIAPVSPRNNNEFWKHDVKRARRIGFDADNAFIDEFANLASEDRKALGLNTEMLRDMRLDDSMYQNTWSPYAMRNNFDTFMGGAVSGRDNYSTVYHHPFKRMFSRQDSHEVKSRNRFSVGNRRYTGGRMGDMNTNYHLLSENIPRCTTMPSKSYSDIRPTTADTHDDGVRRKFIVTPAEDPLYKDSDA